MTGVQTCALTISQSITALSPSSLVNNMEDHFKQPGQIGVALNTACHNNHENGWQAAAILLHHLPTVGGEGVQETSFSTSSYNPDIRESSHIYQDSDDVWNRNRLFLKSATKEELTGKDVSAEDLLYRLFNEDGVYTGQRQILKRVCHCDVERLKAVLRSLPEQELAKCFTKAKNGYIESACAFCGAVYRLTESEIVS